MASPSPDTATELPMDASQPEDVLAGETTAAAANSAAAAGKPLDNSKSSRRPVVAAPAEASSPRKSSKKKKGAPPQVTMATASASVSSSAGAQGENTGRWTAEEHRLFLQGLEQHGKGWKKIASLIKSRTVVQIRTHAQKYFQKLAKARQNGEEGDVTMEGRGGVASVTSVSTAAAAQSNKRRRQTSGTKRKAIQSVVTSAVRQGKKQAAAGETPTLPAVAPALAHFLMPAPSQGTAGSCVPSITTAQGTISGPALEDSLFRFLTPVPVATAEPQVNEVARQAGANPIALPTDNPSVAPTVGEISPTGVQDMAIYPSWTDAKDPPEWYSKGADVDALLDVGDSLDWLADTGDLNETYQASEIDTSDPPDHSDMGHHSGGRPSDIMGGQVNSTSVSTLPHVDSNVESVVPPLPSLFDGGNHHESTVDLKTKIKLEESPSEPALDEHLQVFDTPMEEQDFVSTILETAESSASLPVLG